MTDMETINFFFKNLFITLNHTTDLLEKPNENKQTNTNKNNKESRKRNNTGRNKKKKGNREGITRGDSPLGKRTTINITEKQPKIETTKSTKHDRGLLNQAKEDHS